MSMDPKKLLYIFDQNDWKSRIPLAVQAAENGWDVAIGVVGDGSSLPEDDNYNNLRLLSLKKPQGTLNPASAMGLIKTMRATLEDEKPDLIHTVTLKYAFLAGLARDVCPQAAAVYTIAGLGFLFRSGGFKPYLVRAIVSPYLKMILRAKNTSVIFQNPDDRNLLLRKGYVTPYNSQIILGSGVDLKRFAFAPLPKIAARDKPLVLMPTRLVKEKGIEVFVQAARKVNAKETLARFAIAGGETPHNPKAISAREMRQIVADGTVTWLGHVDDMPGLLQQASLIVYPSYYGEGIPRVLLEATACGRPIITTDHPGCREAVAHGDNGLLVPVRNSLELANAIHKLLHNDNERRKMGRRSRARAEEEFDLHQVVRQTLAVYEAYK